MSSRPGTDTSLLLLAGAFLFVNFISLGIQRESALRLVHWSPFLVWLLCAVAGQRWLAWRMPQGDRMLLPLVMLQAGWGLLLIDRLVPAFAERQTMWLPGGLVIALGLVAWPPLLQRARITGRLPLLVISLLLVAAIIIEGESAGLPGELLKLVLVVHSCAWLASRSTDAHPETWLRSLGWRTLLWAVPLIILVWQRDPGTALLTAVIMLLLLNVASRSSRLLIGSLALCVVSGLFAWWQFEVVRQRVAIWLDPWADAGDSGYQLVQGLLAFAEGGLAGTGVGQGQPLFIPIVHTDFVLAALAEEWGLLGVLALLSCMAIVTLRGLQITERLRARKFECLLALGMTLLLAVQGLTICAGVLTLLPLTGVTLPFLGYGGSSLLTSLLAAALLIRLSGESTEAPS